MKQPSQILVERPSDYVDSPVGPWFSHELPGYVSLGTDDRPDPDELVEEGDYVFTDDGEINDTKRPYALVVDVNGKEVSYDDSKSYAVYDRQGEMGDCNDEPASEFFSVFRKV